MKEFLKPCVDGTYDLVTGTHAADGWIEVPEGAEYLILDNEKGFIFAKDFGSYVYHISLKTFNRALWQRPTQLEELPFIDDEPKDNVNHPSHYTNGKVECIDALESATVGKNGIEAVCVANVIKYLWRYEDKNGNEDVKKAKWYLDKLLNVLENK